MSRDQLSDNWRRTICRCAFLLCCALPTTLTSYWIFHPQTAGDWEKTIRAELGLATEIDSIETPGPNVTILRGIKLTDPLSGELFSTTQIRVIRGTPNRIVVDYPTTISCRALVQLIKKSSENLVGPRLDGFSWRLEFADTATISGERQTENAPSIVTSGLQIDFNQYVDGPAAEIQFRLKDDPTRTVIRGYMHRGLDAPPQFGLQTSEQFLPCWLLSNVVPDLVQLGLDCQFNGSLIISPSERDVSQLASQINGTFRKIDLAKFIAPYEQVLTGECTATVDNLVIQNGQVFSLGRAKIGCNRGEIGMQLLASATLNLGFETDPNAEAPPDNSQIEFRNLDLTCKLENGQLSFQGNLQGMIAYDAFGNGLVGCFNKSPRSLDDLAKFLVQPNAEDERLTEKMLAVLNRFHRPALSIGAEPVRVADRSDDAQY